MLRKAWDAVANKVGYGVACVGQTLDRSRIDALEERIRNARDHKMVVAVNYAGYWGPYSYRVDTLTPQEAARVIEESERDREALTQRMEERAKRHKLAPVARPE